MISANIRYYYLMIKINAYTVDELRDLHGLKSDKELGRRYGLGATSIQHYRAAGVLLAETDSGIKRISDLRAK